MRDVLQAQAAQEFLASTAHQTAEPVVDTHEAAVEIGFGQSRGGLVEDGREMRLALDQRLLGTSAGRDIPERNAETLDGREGTHLEPASGSRLRWRLEVSVTPSVLARR